MTRQREDDTEALAAAIRLGISRRGSQARAVRKSASLFASEEPSRSVLDVPDRASCQQFATPDIRTVFALSWSIVTEAGDGQIERLLV